MPKAQASGTTTARPPMAAARRRSPAASRRSRSATNRAWAVSGSFSLVIQLSADEGQVDVLERGQLAQLLAQLEPGPAAQVGEVAFGQQETAGHDADPAGQRLRLLHR